MTEPEPLEIKQGVKTRTVWHTSPPTDFTGATGHLVAKRDGRPHVELDGDWLDATVGDFLHDTDGTLPVGRYKVELQVYDSAGELIAISPSDDYENLIITANLGTVTP